MSPIIDKIPAKMKAAALSEASGNVLVVGRMVYASLYTATRPSKSETDPKRFHYANTLLVPDGFDLTVLEAEVQRLFEENVPEAKRSKTKWRNPIMKTAEAQSLASLADEYPTMLRANSKAFQKDGKPRPAPGVVDAKGQPVPANAEADETYNGRWCRTSFNPYWYAGNDGLPGVSLGLVNVQLLWHDDPMAGGKVNASAEFEAVDGVDLEDMAAEFE